MALIKHLKSVDINTNKHTVGLIVVPMPLPDRVYIGMTQGGCTPSVPLVKPGDYVKVGQLIADGEGPLSCPIHASVSGRVAAITNLYNLYGKKDLHIVIESDKRQENEDIHPVVPGNRREFFEALRNSGIIEPSEGEYPLHYKFGFDEGRVDTLIVNGAECDSFVTVDHITMMTYSADILSGIRSIMRGLGIPRSIIAVSDDKPDVIRLFRKYLTDLYIDDITLAEIPTSYPNGEENSIVFAAAERRIPAGGKPIDVGVVTCNVTCILKFKQYLDSGMPLVSRPVTLDGDAVNRPQNIEVPVGTLAEEIIRLCKGTSTPIKKVIFGGPVAGYALGSLACPTNKLVNGIIVFSEDAAGFNKETPCIRCGRCTRSCPINLMPAELASAYEYEEWDKLKRMKAQLCIGCKSCSYICPARRPLAFRIMQAKEFLDREEVNVYGK